MFIRQTGDYAAIGLHGLGLGQGRRHWHGFISQQGQAQSAGSWGWSAG